MNKIVKNTEAYRTYLLYHKKSSKAMEFPVQNRYNLAVRGVAQLASARGLGPRGRRFESSHPDQ